MVGEVGWGVRHLVTSPGQPPPSLPPPPPGAPPGRSTHVPTETPRCLVPAGAECKQKLVIMVNKQSPATNTVHFKGYRGISHNNLPL